MNPRNWLRSYLASPSISRFEHCAPKRRPGFRPTVEALEGRTLPSASLSIAGATINEIGDVSAFVTAGSGGLSSPRGMTLGPDGSLYVASSTTNSVIRYNATGGLIGTFVAANSGGMTSPYGVAFGPDGNLYVSSDSNLIYRYSGATGAYLNTFVPAGSGGLDVAKGIVFGPDGNLYVASFNTDAILRYQGPFGVSPGAPLPSTGNSGATFVVSQSGGLDGPHTAIFGPDGNLYVSSTAANNAVLRFDGTTGNFLGTFVASGVGGLGVPRGLAFDQDNRLYVADFGTFAIHRYDSQGQFLDDPVPGPSSSVVAPLGILFDPQGTLIISSRDTNAVVRYDRGAVVTLSAVNPTPVSVDYSTMDGTASASGDYSAQSGSVTFAPGQTSRRILLATKDDVIVEGNEPFSVQLTNATGGATIAAGTAELTIVDDDAVRQVTISDASPIEGDHTAHYRGSFVEELAGASVSLPAFGPDGNFYTVPLAGSSAGAVDQYDGTTGTFIKHLVPVGRVNSGRDMGFSNGYLYIGEESNDDVLRFNATTGSFDRVFVTAGSGGLDGPHGLTFGPDANGDGIPELYVSGRNSFNVVRYDGATGQPLGTYVSSGSGGLSWPEALTFDPSGTYLYVASTGSNQILKYNALTGAYVGVGASTGLSAPKGVKFGPDGLMYVASANNNRILRFTASGTYVDDYVPAGSGGMTQLSRLVFGPDGDVYVSVGGPGAHPNLIYRFGPEPEALFAVSISTASPSPLTVDFATADGSAVAGRNYATTAGTLTFAPGVTSKTIRVPLLNDGSADPSLTFTVNLSNPVAAILSRSQAIGTISDSNTAAKFFVVNDSTSSLGGTNTTYKYQATGSAEAPYGLSLSDLDPRGVASTAAGTTNWVVDANKNVYVYNISGSLLGFWSAGGLSSSGQLTGIATNGTDVWLVDSNADKIYKYTGAASRLSGSQNAASSFALVSGHNGNTDPQDIVTDGTSFWVVDGSRLKVFKYTLSGSSLGSWTIDPANAHSTGITIDPTNVSNIWIVDNGTAKVYQYTAAASRTSGSQNASTTFPLAAGDSNPQGIADPPPLNMMVPLAAVPNISPPPHTMLAKGRASFSNQSHLDDALWGALVSRAPSNGSEWLWPGKQGERNCIDVRPAEDHELRDITGLETTYSMAKALAAGIAGSQPPDRTRATWRCLTKYSRTPTLTQAPNEQTER